MKAADELTSILSGELETPLGFGCRELYGLIHCIKSRLQVNYLLPTWSCGEPLFYQASS